MDVRKAIANSLRLLNRRDRRLLSLAALIQIGTSVLDLVGVLLIGLVGALAVTTVQSQPPPASVTAVAQSLGLQEQSSQELVLIFSGAAAVVLLTKSVVSSYLMRRVFIFLANRQALVSARLTRELLSRPLIFIQRRSSQETAYALIQGAGLATVQILGQTVIIITEAALLIALATALLVLNPVITLVGVAFFAGVAVVLQATTGGWAAKTGSKVASADILSLDAVQEAIAAYREISVTHRRALYVDRIQDLRWQAARLSAGLQFVGLLPKYIFEAALVIGGFALAAFLFATQDSVAAVSTLALFLAAGSRVMPSLLRLQTGALNLRGAAGGAAPTFELARELENPLEEPERLPTPPEIRKRIREGWPTFEAALTLEDVTFTYPGASRPALQDLSLNVPPGTSLALVGASGAGKSTFADLVLGVLLPDEGAVSLSGLVPQDAVARWPGGIAYVPQEVTLANGTIRDNVALGLPREAIDDDLVWEALERAHLADYLRSERDSLETRVGEGGMRLSGGQRQRLGLARALYTRPHLLVLDEATSALDAETEQAVAATIEELGGQVTTIVIAHRLSTVRSADLVLYLEDGRAVAQGTFDEVRAQVPALDRQAGLMGLT